MNCNKTPETGSSIYVNGCGCNCLWKELHEMEGSATDGAAAVNKRENTGTGCMPNDDFASWPVGMTYVPMQPWEEPFELAKGLRAGTIFPGLRLPFRGGGR